jgi:plastocyanin
MKLLYAVLTLVIISSATTTIYFTYYTSTFYTTDVFQLENEVASLESEISSLKSSIASDLKNAYDDGYSAGIEKQSSSSDTSSSNTSSSNTDAVSSNTDAVSSNTDAVSSNTDAVSSNTDAVSSNTRTIGTVEKSGYSTDCAVPMGGDGCYTPVNLSANVGDKIIMTNTDSTGIHSFTSGTVDGFAPSPDGTFDTGILMSGDSFEWTPTVSGEYPYYCMLHAWQVGTITVN